MPDDKIPQGNDGAADLKGNPPPPPPSNDPPPDAGGPTPEQVAALAAAEKLVADNKAAKEKAAPKPDPKPEPDPEKDPDPKDKDATPLDTDKWGSTGHEGGDAVLGLMQNAGLEPEQAKALLFDAVAAGDLKKVDRAKLVEAIGEDKAKLVMIGAQSFVDAKATKNAEIVKTMHEVSGGEENWKKVAAWAKDDSDFSDDDMAEYITMIDNGGKQARFAAAELVAAYNASDKNTTLDAPGVATPIVGDNSNTPGGRSLSRNDYAAEVAALHRNGAVPSETALAELSAARRRGRASA
jgi:hypothetical protein